jgi:NADH-quinone oxidoreductase subunit N
MVGFFAKLSVLQPLLASGQPMLLGLAIYAVLLSLIGAFYYLRIVKVMYFDAPISVTEPVSTMEVRTVLAVNGALVILLGLFPSGLMQLCLQAIVKTLAG